MFEKILASIVTLAAVVVAAALAHREWSGGASPVVPERDVPVYDEDWRAAGGVGRMLGDSNAAVHVVEFSDLECPFCAESYARFHSDSSSIAQRFHSRVAYTFVHFPLRSHRFARPAARGAECARNAGRFFPFVSAVFSKQDSLGLRPWTAYAQDAGVTDLDRFLRCVSSASPLTAVDMGVALGMQMNVSTTPTVFINGWRYSGVLPESTYVAAIDSLLAGRKPRGAKH